MSSAGNDWNISSEDQALVDSFGSDQPTNEAPAEESVNIENTAVVESEEGQSEANAQETDATDESLQADGQADESAEEENSEEPSEELVIKGPSGKEIKVDLNPDQDKLVKLHQAADRARMYQSELDKLKHQVESNESEMEGLKETAGHYKMIEDVVEDLDFNDPASFNELVALVTGNELNMEALIEKAIEEREEVSALSEEGIAIWEERKRLKREQRELEKAKARAERDAKAKEADRAKQQEENQRELIYQAFQKHDIRGKTGNAGYEEKVMKAAWNNSKEELIKLQAEGKQITFDLVDQIFKDEIDGLYQPAAQVQKQAAAKAVTKAKAKATAAAQKAATKKASNLQETLKQYKNPMDLLNDANAINNLELGSFDWD